MYVLLMTLDMPIAYIIPRKLKLEKKIQNWVRSSVCGAVCSWQTVAQKDSIEAFNCTKIEILWYRKL